jgi:uncharacterized membrane protein YozB (DUF420 family)
MKHATIMGISIVLHTVSIVAIMVPSLLSMGGLFENLLTRFALVTVIHAMIGSLVELMGIWLIATWLSHTYSIEKCFKKKNTMKVTMTLWLMELILGAYMYMMLYIAA